MLHYAREFDGTKLESVGKVTEYLIGTCVSVQSLRD
jgi:hypothetical protein